MVQVGHFMLFEILNAVVSFDRWPELAEAFVQRLLFFLSLVYFANGACQDRTSGVRGRRPTGEFARVLGSP